LGVFIVGGSFSASPLMSFFFLFVFFSGYKCGGRCGLGVKKVQRS
jgi:hypothetical protein